MADDYLSDEERAEALREWWSDNWRWIFGGVGLGIALLVGWWQWQAYHAERSVAASQLYSEVQTALGAQDTARADQLLSELASKYDSTPYAHQARLLRAKTHADAGKFDEAVALLRTVADKSKDAELAKIAKLRLARILIQQQKHDEALALLKADKDSAFAGQLHEIRGDALYAKGDHSGARAEYAAALTADDAQIDRPTLQLKLQEVGGHSPAAAAKGQP